MTERPVNLNKVRKARAKAARKTCADRNAVIHGLPKAARAQARAEADRAARTHEGGRRTGRDDDDSDDAEA